MRKAFKELVNSLLKSVVQESNIFSQSGAMSEINQFLSELQISKEIDSHKGKSYNRNPQQLLEVVYVSSAYVFQTKSLFPEPELFFRVKWNRL